MENLEPSITNQNTDNTDISQTSQNDEDVSISTQLSQWFKRKKPWLIITSLTAMILFIFFWQSVVITIKSGEAGVLFRYFSGTEIDTVYEEGVHIFSPLDTLYRYEIRKQTALHEFNIISNKGLTIHLSLAVRYRPEVSLLGILHQQIGPDYLDRVVLPQIESVMRKELGSYTAEQIYTNEAGLLTKAILNALDEVGRNYVEVEDIIIRSISLPQEIVKAIEHKLQQEEFMKSYEFRIETAKKEAERLKSEAEGIASYNKIISQSLTKPLLLHKGIDATKMLAESNNAKVVVIGSGENGLPIILNTEDNYTNYNNHDDAANETTNEDKESTTKTDNSKHNIEHHIDDKKAEKDEKVETTGKP
ncbi:MAG TPA: prohibitin family protein [Thiothrix sp.]|nr:prohibitin family protein [Thiothrix sp.]